MQSHQGTASDCWMSGVVLLALVVVIMCVGLIMPQKVTIYN